MTKPVMIVGAGGHAKVVLEALLKSGRVVRGFTDCQKNLWDTKINSIPVVGNDDILFKMGPDNVEVAIGMGAIARYGDNGLGQRMKIFKTLRDAGFSFASVVGPGTFVSSDAKIGVGTQIMAGAIIQPGCQVGENVILNTRALIDHECIVENHCHLAPGAILCANVSVARETFVGAGAVVIQGIEIGARSLIAAGAIVSRKVEPGTTYDRRIGPHDQS